MKIVTSNMMPMLPVVNLNRLVVVVLIQLHLYKSD